LALTPQPPLNVVTPDERLFAADSSDSGTVVEADLAILDGAIEVEYVDASLGVVPDEALRNHAATPAHVKRLALVNHTIYKVHRHSLLFSESEDDAIQTSERDPLD
jgi:hypothetical protein